MARKKASPALVFPFQGKTFWLESKITSWLREQHQKRIVASGGVVVEEIDDKLDYLVLPEMRRNSPATSQAEKKAAKVGGAITTIYVGDLTKLLCPSRELALALIQGGPDMAERWLQIQPAIRDTSVRIDLTGADLRKLDLSNFHFHGCVLDGLLLDGATLHETYFFQPKRTDFRPARQHGIFLNGAEECNFDGITLHAPWFSGNHEILRCSFRGATFQGQHQAYGDFKSCDMTEVNAEGVEMRHWKTDSLHAPRARFSNANLKHAVLRSANLTDAIFTNANLEETDLSLANLRGANLEGANLCGANLANADLTDAELRGANLADADLSHATVASADFTGANLRGTKLTSVKKELATGLTEGADAVPTAGPMLQKLQKSLAASRHFELHFTLEGPTHGLQEIRISQYSNGQAYVYIQDRDGYHNSRPKSWDGYLLDTATHQTDSVPRLDTIKVKPAGSLTIDLVQALCELFHQPIPEAKDLAKAKKAAKASITNERDTVVAELRKKGGVATWNERPRLEREKLGNFDGCDLSNADLREIDLNYLKANEANFSKANLQKAKLANLKLRKANLSEANLQSAIAHRIDAKNANASKANLSKAGLSHSVWDEANLTNANLTGAELTGASFLGADLTGAKLDGIKINDTRYDAQTKFPAGFVPDLGWKLVGAPPATALVPTPTKQEMPFAEFFGKLPTVADDGRIRNALSMLKKDKFSLFAETGDSQVIGVVRSQSSSERVYACRLTAQGQYECGTQNLRPCGGLQGKVCKHLLVLIVGLTRSGTLDSGSAFQWMQMAQRQSPTFDKEAMTATFLRFKSVEAGEVDWRPTETVPEDYYAL